MSQYQNRIFLQLIDDNETSLLIKKILKSPLGLSKEIIKNLFSGNFDSLKDNLDKIKMFSAGISRSESLANDYKLAYYYSYMFSFHQYFHSSYRARQGKVLEEMIKNILTNYSNCDEVPDKVIRMHKILNDSFKGDIQNLDIDVLGNNNKEKKIILIQLRSRDDTGGTTAKGSLVDMLRSLLRINKQPNKNVLYLISIWDERNKQQKNSTIEKMYSSLKDYIPNKENFIGQIIAGYKFNDKITLKLAYGVEEISLALFDWVNKKDKKILKAIQEIIKFVETWDDLWLAYSIANLEIEQEKIVGYSNITLLKNKMKELNLKIKFENYEELSLLVDDITNKLIPIWKEDSIPLNSLSDKAHYIRDLVFLKFCFERINAKS